MKKFKHLRHKAGILLRLAEGEEQEFLCGYLRGLQRAYWGSRFGSEDEHIAWLRLGEDDDDARGRGYRAGLAGRDID